MLNKSISQFLNFSISQSCRRQIGFTLMEIIVVIALLGVVGMMAVNIFFTSLRGSTKAETLKEIKQNGDFAISTMERMIRNAQEVTSTCSGSSSSITIRNPDNWRTTFSCGNQIASISADLVPPVTTYLTSSKVYISDCYFICDDGGLTPDKVTIHFALCETGAATPRPVRPEERASVTFETTVSLRDY